MRDMLPHPNVGNFLDLYLFEKSELWMMTEFMEGGRSLGEIIANTSTTFTEEQVAKICLDACKGLAHLHSQLILHRDIRSDSIVIDVKGRVKLTGFGFAVQLPDKQAKRRTMVSTLNLPTRSPYTVDKTHWTAPEVIKKKEYGPEVDVWAFGITIIEMLEGAPPYAGEEPLKVLFLTLVNGTPELKQPDTLSDELKDFLGNCLDVDVECRSTMSELVEHDFLKKACPPSGLAPLFEWKPEAPVEIVDAVVSEETEPSAPDAVDTAVPVDLDSAAAYTAAPSDTTNSVDVASATPETLASAAPDPVALEAVKADSSTALDPPATETAGSIVPQTVEATLPDDKIVPEPPASAPPDAVTSAAPDASEAVAKTAVSSAPETASVAPGPVDPAPDAADAESRLVASPPVLPASDPTA
ncbi:kinase-like domain-containing protein [Mycena rosella]|uniref:Kinase-like domain-containing protein n=1 Tax=Mycena rosella TaxID=1033263 RepID=A0AAD7CDJ7_MYCRO|nr:kinase-like domain-containing protein [Mycena rosella]